MAAKNTSGSGNKFVSIFTKILYINENIQSKPTSNVFLKKKEIFTAQNDTKYIGFMPSSA